MNPGDIVEFEHDSTKNRIPCKLIVEDAGIKDALMFRQHGTESEYLWMTTDARGGCGGQEATTEAPYRMFIPEYHSTGESHQQKHLEVVVSLRSVAAVMDQAARKAAQGAYLGFKGKFLCGMVPLGHESRFRVKVIGHVDDERVHHDPEKEDLLRSTEPKMSNKYPEFGSGAGAAAMVGGPFHNR